MTSCVNTIDQAVFHLPRTASERGYPIKIGGYIIIMIAKAPENSRFTIILLTINPHLYEYPTT